MSTVVALFLLSQVFLILSHGPLVRTLAAVILKSNLDLIKNGASKILEEYEDVICSKDVAFLPPQETLEKSLETLSDTQNGSSKLENVEELNEDEEAEENNKLESEIESINEEGSEKEKQTSTEPKLNEPSTSQEVKSSPLPSESDKSDLNSEKIEDIKHLSVTDEEKEKRLALESPLNLETSENISDQEFLSNKPFLETVLNSLYCTENDYAALFALCLLYALINNSVTIND